MTSFDVPVFYMRHAGIRHGEWREGGSKLNVLDQEGLKEVESVMRLKSATTPKKEECGGY